MSVRLRNYAFDDDGSPVPATVTAVGRNLGKVYSDTADETTGEWLLDEMDDDIYDVTITYLGKVRKHMGDVQIQVEGFVDTVGSTPVADGSVTTGKLADGSVTSIKIASGAVTAAKLGVDSVGSAALASGAVEESNIADGAVTTSKLGAAAVTTAKIADGSVTLAKLASDVSTGGGGGALTDGSVTTAKIADGAVTAAKISPGTITANELAMGSVTGPKIAGGAVQTAQIAANAVNTSKIANGAVTAEKLASGLLGGSSGIDTKQAFGSITYTLNTTITSVVSVGSLTAGTYLIIGSCDAEWRNTTGGTVVTALYDENSGAALGNSQGIWANSSPAIGDRHSFFHCWFVTLTSTRPVMMTANITTSGPSVRVNKDQTKLMAVRLF